MDLIKFEAPTLAQALQVVKRELGPEAVILSTKNKKSAFGLMNRTSVEVTATITPEALERKRLAENTMTDAQIASLQHQDARKIAQTYDVLSGNRLTRQMQAQATSQNPLPRQETARPAPQPSRPLTQRRYVDIQDDESPAEQMTNRSKDRASLSAQSQGTSTRTVTAQNWATPPKAAVAPAARAPTANSSGVLSKILAQLIDAGVEADLVRELGDELKVIMLKDHVTREENLRLHMARIMMARLRVARPLGERLRIPNTPRMIAFVGPTGVGKTTTVAKIAAELVMSQQRPVTLATTDTYKIAAVEQLQTYANILRVPIEVCPTADSLAHLSAQLSPNDVVLIDTAGYGPKDEKKLHELHDVLSGVRVETHLCLSSTTRDRDLTQIVSRFGLFEPNYLVMTKLDETSLFGNLFNLCVRSHLPLSYLTMGQRVPEDIEVATKERVADLLLNISGG